MGLTALGNLSGEWLIGGIEAKVVAYGILFAVVAILIDDRFPRRRWHVVAVAVLAGAAVSFHPVVGIWGVCAATFASLARIASSKRSGATSQVPVVAGHGDLASKSAAPDVGQTPVLWIVAAVVAGSLTAAPGIVAGLRAASGSSVVADYIQIYYRLAHHLDPMHFAADSLHFWESPWFGYAVLAVIWLIGRRAMCASASARVGFFGLSWRHR